MSDHVATPSTEGRVLVAGSIAYDQIMDFPGKFEDHILPDKIHMINLSFLVEEFRKRRGGCAANIGYSLALLGERATLVATAGNDFDDFRAFLEGEGVDLGEVVVHDDMVTASCFITTDRANNQITGFYPGAMWKAREISMAEAAGRADDARYVMVAPDDPEAMLRHCREAKEAGVPLLFDPSFQVIAFDGDQLREASDGAYAVFTNDYEYAVIQEKTGLDDDGLLELAELWIVTLGAEGSRIVGRGGVRHEIPAAPISDVVDPTGAGDAYRAGFLAGLVRGAELPVCGRLGSVAAAYAVESYGTQEHRYTRDEFVRRYRASFGDDA
jgi:adenosine kinase